MKPPRRLLALAAIAAMLLATGCGSLGEDFLGGLKVGAVDAIKTATSQAIEKAVSDIGTQIEQQLIQNLAGATTGG